MKYWFIFIFIFIFISSLVLGSELKLGTMLHYHTLGNSDQFKSNLTQNGRIVSSPLFINWEHFFADQSSSNSFFISTDSIGSPLIGAIYNINLYTSDDETNILSAYMGGYLINAHRWRSIQSLPIYYTQIFNDKLGLVFPILGFKLENKFYQNKSYYCSVLSSISLPLISLGLFITFPFK